MCGIFGIISAFGSNKNMLKKLSAHAAQRGMDSSGLAYIQNDNLNVERADYKVQRLVREIAPYESKFVIGHSRLATNGVYDNQPIVRDNFIVVHNGIITNADELWETEALNRELEVDTEIIPALLKKYIKTKDDIDFGISKLFQLCEGVISAIIIAPGLNSLIVVSNNGSLYVGKNSGNTYISSESYPLSSNNITEIEQVFGWKSFVLDISGSKIVARDLSLGIRDTLLPKFTYSTERDKLLQFDTPKLQRCNKCILPSTMPYIKFDENGVCNYCKNYVIKNQSRPFSELEGLVEQYRRNGERDCIVPFSGGRDSCHSLHLIVKKLKMKPIAYTYDWGMVTDLGRRNISRMCSALGVENIIVAADIKKKRDNIKKNLSAWLKNPHLGMISILTAGDKHFFKYCEEIRKQTGISLNIWGTNPLETTHFKAGFLGIAPSFENKAVYNSGWASQITYQTKRLKQFMLSPSYFNSSLLDTYSGEYWRSINKRTDYFHLYDYKPWNEEEVDNDLAQYNWEWAKDTKTSWR
ncbi:glucosamine 6-phosphate synthetase, partial [Paracoccaceae bacterium]|nr:glucosamine 6-phosphate synthetase [Paracoccaceae bacterium]